MKELGQDNFLYVADSALVTKENLTLMDDWKSGFRYVSRLPAVYKECGRAIAEAVREGINTRPGHLVGRAFHSQEETGSLPWI